MIVESLKKTNRVAFIDEDVPGGATAFMMQKVLERDGGYDWLDSAAAHPRRQGPSPRVRLGRRLLVEAEPRDDLCGGVRAGARGGEFFYYKRRAQSAEVGVLGVFRLSALRAPRLLLRSNFA